MRAASIAMVGAIAITGCGAFASQPPGAMVTIYGRNGGPAEFAWFAIDPTSSTQPQVVGFGDDTGGAACLEAAIGSRLVMLDKSIAERGTIVGIVAPVDELTETYWIDVARDGGVTTGLGVPPWWSGDPTAC
jgi:hypothetical protein